MLKPFFKLILFTILLLMSKTTSAVHIVGGEMNYECLGNGTFKITLRIYRDCNISTPFDFNAAIAVFEGSTLPPVQSRAIPLASTNIVNSNNGNTCSVGVNTCIEEGLYIDTITVPYSSMGYNITYQRCCRNVGVTNISNTQSWGTSITIFISDLAQQTCNNSPTFDNLPPTFICQGEPIDFNFGATDLEGDSLSYSFCAPFDGSGNFGIFPPPYSTIDFVTPYSATFPLQGSPLVNINDQTGFIAGTPSTLGLFTVGVCVKEYRNGILLSTTTRDFQFTVIDCITLDAEVDADVRIDGSHFVYNQCNGNTLTMINESFKLQNIDNYLWEFDINGNSVTANTADATFTFPTFGTYEGTMIVSSNSIICSDTAFIIVNILPSPTVDFQFAFDSCELDSIDFVNLSIAHPLDSIANWQWSFGNGDSSQLENPIYLYPNAGDFDVILTATGNNGCEESLSKSLTWAPTPIIDIEIDKNWACDSDTIHFENLSLPQEGYTTIWNFGDGNTSTTNSPFHTYQQSGIYDIAISMISPLGCVSTDTFLQWIEVYNAPLPHFEMNYDSCENLPIQLQDLSLAGSSPITEWQWNFGNGDNIIQNQNDPIEYLYTETGNFTISLIITDSIGCIKTVEQNIHWYPIPTIALGDTLHQGCPPFEVYFENLSTPIDGYSHLWNLGDGYYSSDVNPVHTYQETGIYDVKYSIAAPSGCFREYVFSELVNVKEAPKAHFDFAPNLPNHFEPTITFNNHSAFSNQWFWNFGDGDFSTNQHPIHTFEDTGQFEIQLIATNNFLCSDTIKKVIDIEPGFTYYLPNAFTPNGDGINDGYRGVGELFDISDFKMTIWNRWGTQVFTTQDPTQSWDGRIQQTGEMVQSGVYVVTVTFISSRGKREEIKGFATVVR